MTAQIKTYEILLDGKNEIKQSKTKKAKMLRFFFEEVEDYYKPVTVGNFWNSNYIEYEINGDEKNL